MTLRPERVVRVLPDVVAIDKEFDYLLPPSFEGAVGVGTMVRVVLGARRVGGWVTALDVEPPEGVVLRPLAHVSGWGPPDELLALAGWAAWRWAGHRAHFLRSASPGRAVRFLPAPSTTPRPPDGASLPSAITPVVSLGELTDLITEAFAGETRVLRLPPAADPTPVILSAVAHGPTLVLVPALARAAVLANRLRQAGRRVAVMPDEWAQARGGVDVVVGGRAAAWAPCPSLAAVVVVDAHDEAYVSEAAPTWGAVEVVVERARRAAVPCVLVSATPTLRASGAQSGVSADPGAAGGDYSAPNGAAWRGADLVPSRGAQRRGWAPMEVIDRRSDDPRLGLWSAPLARAIAQGARVACVLNRRGRARLLACAACGALVRCERCGAAVGEDPGEGPSPRRSPATASPKRNVAALVCPRCATARPGVCLSCGSTALKRLRVGVTRAAEELAALTGRPVTEVSGPASLLGPTSDLLVGTEAVLHRSGPLDVVAFVDFDQELLAPRYRAGEDALGMLGRAARLVGGRRRSGRVLVQTRMPEHPVLEAAVAGDYDRWAEPELRLRQELRLPPFASLATVSGDGAPVYVDGLHARRAPAGGDGVEILGPADGRWLVKAPGPAALADLLAQVPRPALRLRVEVGGRRV